MNPDTLWERVNDAVDTIIRRDESSETGDLLPPCVEGICFYQLECIRISTCITESIPSTLLCSCSEFGLCSGESFQKPKA